MPPAIPIATYRLQLTANFDFFDIDWDILPYRARPGVLLPIIGSSYGEALIDGRTALADVVPTHEVRFPSPRKPNRRSNSLPES
jgi:maltooligosyltrehalose synthase